MAAGLQATGACVAGCHLLHVRLLARGAARVPALTSQQCTVAAVLLLSCAGARGARPRAADEARSELAHALTGGWRPRAPLRRGSTTFMQRPACGGWWRVAGPLTLSIQTHTYVAIGTVGLWDMGYMGCIKWSITGRQKVAGVAKGAYRATGPSSIEPGCSRCSQPARSANG